MKGRNQLGGRKYLWGSCWIILRKIQGKQRSVLDWLLSLRQDSKLGWTRDWLATVLRQGKLRNWESPVIEGHIAQEGHHQQESSSHWKRMSLWLFTAPAWLWKKQCFLLSLQLSLSVSVLLSDITAAFFFFLFSPSWFSHPGHFSLSLRGTCMLSTFQFIFSPANFQLWEQAYNQEEPGLYLQTLKAWVENWTLHGHCGSFSPLPPVEGHNFWLEGKIRAKNILLLRWCGFLDNYLRSQNDGLPAARDRENFIQTRKKIIFLQTHYIMSRDSKKKVNGRAKIPPIKMWHREVPGWIF